MSSNFKKAQKGSVQEILNMVEENAGNIYFLLATALREESDNEKAVSAIFKKVLPLVINKTINTEEELSAALTDETVRYCRKILDKKYKAFKVPQNKNYSNIVYNKSIITQKDSMCNLILEALPKFHRFVYILRHTYDYDTTKIANLLKTNADTINVILKVEEANLERIGRIAKEAIPGIKAITADEFHHELSAAKSDVKVSESIKTAVSDYAEKICAPLMAKEKKKKIKISVIAICLAVIVGIIAYIGISKMNSHTTTIGESDVQTDITATDDANVQEEMNEQSDSKEILNNSAAQFADIEIENYGTVTVALNSNEAPQTVENFVNLANEGFYDGLTFHRIMDGFMMQGGDPNGDGTGGSDKNVVGEFSENGYENNISHTRGTISMARSGEYNSGSSQFFIVHEDSTFLDGQYAAFGQVTAGMEIVDEICAGAKPTDDNGTIPEEEQPIIKSVTIR